MDCGIFILWTLPGNKKELLLDTVRWMNCIIMFEQKKEAKHK